MMLYSIYTCFLSDRGEYGLAADVFSFGILLHEIISGHVAHIAQQSQPGNLPFAGSRNEATLCLAILGGFSE